MPDPILLELNGDVVGPVSAVDNSMVLFDGTTGKLIKGNNAVVTAAGLALLDDNNATEQRNTLGLGSMATQNSNGVVISGGVITGITDLTVADGGTGASTAAQARTNLGILFGTTAGTYMEGNDGRVVNAVPNTRQVIAGSGLTGGGALSADRTLNIGTPSDININSTNSASGTTHSHRFDFTSFLSVVMQPNGQMIFGDKTCIQWGRTAQIGGSNTIHTSDFNIAFANCAWVGVMTGSTKLDTPLANRVAHLIDFTNTNFRWGSDTVQDGNTNISAVWIAIGKVA